MQADTSSNIVAQIRHHLPVLEERFNVVDLAVFGSVARGQATEASDIDILVGFKGPASSSDYFGLQFYLEDLLGKPVDLVTDKALRPELRPFIEKDAFHVR